MAEANRISRYLDPGEYFARSVHLERDFADSTALDRYVVTGRVQQLFERFSTAFGDGSTERAWRITGDYGTGKSCFALALARLCSRNHQSLPKSLKPVLKSLRSADVVPILVTGAGEPISVAIIRALQHNFGEGRGRRKPPLLKKAKGIVDDASPAVRDQYAVDLLEESARFVRQTDQGDGVLLVIDELGRTLEYATRNPDEQDVIFLQTLSEVASRSGSNPIVVLGILHRRFAAYADQMNAAQQREWDKIGGRFAEMQFDQPLEQLAMLVATALGTKVDRLPNEVKQAARENMAKAIQLGWFGPVSNPAGLIEEAPTLFPLQPMLLPVLVRFFSRFGQNERSLFSFLYSSDPNAMRSFASARAISEGFFAIHHFYDFIRSSLGDRLNTRSLSSRWRQIESVVDQSLSSRESEVAMLKTVGVLSMLDDQKLAASEEALRLAFSNAGIEGEPRTKPARRKWFDKTLTTLRAGKHSLYFRGRAAGYCLWPHTSVNLELSYAEAEQVVRTVDDVVGSIMNEVNQRPIVARRHYVTTGTLRHFDVEYVRSERLHEAVAVQTSPTADGTILSVLCETQAERTRAIRCLRQLDLSDRRDTLIAFPQPLVGFTGLLCEVGRWEWIQNNIDDLAGDRYAREEVSRQIAAARAVLIARTSQVLDVRSFHRDQGMEWYYLGKKTSLASSRDLFARASVICDDVFEKSPRLRNELLNRRKLSSAAAAARMRLIERVLENEAEERLGMDERRRPPEMSMYLSALEQSKLHVRRRDGYRLTIPTPSNDPCNLRPLFDRIRSNLTLKEGERVRVSDLFSDLKRKPIGARDGLLPLVLAVFCVAESQHVAIYEDNIFLHDVRGAEFHRLAKVPESFELQYCKLSGIRSEVFHQLLDILDVSPNGSASDGSRKPDLIDAVRPLCEFAANLPDYTRSTSSLGVKALAVRNALLNAEEPSRLVFEQLPAACGHARIPVRDRSDGVDTAKFVRSLKAALGSIRGAYPRLLTEIESAVAETFGIDAHHDDLRKTLAEKANDLAVHVTEPTLKAFCLRLADSHLARDVWLESIGSVILAKPPRRWRDSDRVQFNEAIQDLARRFQNTASVAFARGQSRSRSAIRIAILQSSGEETSRVVEVPSTEAALTLEKRIRELFSENPDAAVPVAARFIQNCLSGESTEESS